MTQDVIGFGEFLVFPKRRILEKRGKAVRLGSRALDILLELLEEPGAIVSKDELTARVWGDTRVGEGSLRVHISTLRKALGDTDATERYITNISGRGYCFTGQLARQGDPASRRKGIGKRPLPRSPTVLAGRDEFVRSAVEQFSTTRLISITGEGGIGKSAVANVIASALEGKFEDGIFYVDLASAQDAGEIAAIVVENLDEKFVSKTGMSDILSRLSDLELLIVFDNCDHVIDATAILTERALAAIPRCRVLATAREALNLPGEWHRRLSPLDSPSLNQFMTLRDAENSPAVSLFVGSVKSRSADFELHDGNARKIVSICELVDGMPLSLELAASRIEDHGLDGLIERLIEDPLSLDSGRRGLASRQKSIRLSLEWSYLSLSVAQACVFRRLGVFHESFTLKAAHAVSEDMGLSLSEFDGIVACLVGKSLLYIDQDAGYTAYRMRSLSRRFAREQLESAREWDTASRLHWGYLRRCSKVLEAASVSSKGRSPDTHAEDLRDPDTSVFRSETMMRSSFRTGAFEAPAISQRKLRIV